MRLRDASLLSLAAAALILSSCTDDSQLTTEQFRISIGDSSVDLIAHRSVQTGLTYVNLHDNENTAVEAGLSVVREHGGTLFELKHTGDRRLSFQIGNSTFTIDPNRIFTTQGIDSTLAADGAISPRARDAVRSFADALLHRFGFTELTLVVALHNNTDERYSVLSYADNGDLANEALFTHVAVDIDPDDFYFVTSEPLYNDLRGAGFNAVMQDIHFAEDDGSLSVFSARQRVPYANVEAQHGHFEVQREMIELLHHMIVVRKTES